MKAILGTGQLGTAIMDCLLYDNPGEEIVLVNRTGKLTQSLPPNVQLVAADVTNQHELEFIARDAEVVYSCTDVPYQDWASFYPATASALSYALSKTKARLVSADNMYSYGNVKGLAMQEGMPHKARTKKGMIRASVIHTLLNTDNEFSSRVAFVKAADFIGPRIHKGLLGTDFLDRLWQGKTISLFGRPELPHTFTYIQDFARAMVNVGSAPDALGQTWHVPNAPAISPKAWIALFEKQTGKTAHTQRLPKAAVRIAGLFNRLVRELYELAYQFEYAYLVNHDKYTARFGNHATGHEEIVTATIDWYKKMHQK